MNYSVIIEGHNEGIVVTQDGGIATFELQDGLFNLCLYQSHIIGFNPKNDAHWDELSDSKMYVTTYTREQLEKRMETNFNCLIIDALEWLCPYQEHQEVEFNKLFKTN